MVVRLIRPVDGVREFAGVLKGLVDNEVRLETEDGERTFARKDISMVHVIDMDEGEDPADDSDDGADGSAE